MNAGLLSQRNVESGAAVCCDQAWWEESVVDGDPKGFLQFWANVVFDKTIMVQPRKIKREKQFSEAKVIFQELYLAGFHSSL